LLLPRDCRHIKIVVFDEADHMWAYDGHQADSVQVLKTLAAAKVSVQVLLFSATFSEAVQRVAEKVVGPTANRVFVPRENLSLEVIKQFRVECASVAAKEEVLSEMILKSAEKLGQTIVFVHTRARATELHAKLHAKGWPCTSISGGPQHDHATRDRVIKEFRSGTTKILIATDVLSRGFDHASVTLVVNFDPPMSRDGKPEPEIYLHRIGRSGRFGRKGAAFNLVSTPQERAVVDAIAAHFKHDIPAVPSNDLDRFEEVLQQAGLA
jgi:ATP-dependent RNA helicase DDX19/DBP5